MFVFVCIVRQKCLFVNKSKVSESPVFFRGKMVDVICPNQSTEEGSRCFMPIEKDEEREKRIDYEIVVDCYDEEERVAGWHCHLEDTLAFPFEAECIEVRKVSPLKKGEKVNVIGMADQDDCEGGMLVLVELFDRTFGVPLEQLQPIDGVGADTLEAVLDWHYWVAQGYRF
jgi:hypothetical protein